MARRFELRGHQIRRFIERSGDHLRHSREGIEIGARTAHGPPAAQEFHPHSIANAIELAQQDRPDLAGARYMRAAASAAVQPFDADNA